MPSARDGEEKLIRRGRWWRSVARNGAVAFVSFLFVLLVWRASHAGGGVAAQFARGQKPPAPAFSLRRLNGAGAVDLGVYAGRVVVLNFWASWCGPCAQEAPGFETAWRHWREHLVTFIGIDAHDFKSDARAFIKRYHLSYPIARDSSDDAVQLYGVGQLPETFVISPQGQVVEHLVGFVSKNKLDSTIARALHGAGAE